MLDKVLEYIVVAMVGATLLVLILSCHPRVGWMVSYKEQVMRIKDRYYKVEPTTYRWSPHGQNKAIIVYSDGRREIKYGNQ